MPRPKRSRQLQEPAACDVEVVDLARVRAARAALPDAPHTSAVTVLFSALADPTRLRIIAALEQGELCVCDIAATVGLTTSAASHQLRVLRERGLVRPRRDGRMVYYAIDDEHVRTLFRQAFEHVAHEAEEGRA
jgi:ArsR family transcriptional regulator, lead/cadmium/zinc/bismuth-responsive transcriptional repressor